MALNDLTADMIATLNNGQRAMLKSVTVRSNKLNKSVLQVLKDEGYITSFEEVDQGNNKQSIKVDLSYYDNSPVIKKIKKVSKSGLRIYSSIKDLGQSFNGLGVKILSTSKGVLPDYKARELNVGGEVICEIF